MRGIPITVNHGSVKKKLEILSEVVKVLTENHYLHTKSGACPL